MSLDNDIKRVRFKYGIDLIEAYEKLYYEYKKNLIKLENKLPMETKIRINRELKGERNGKTSN